MGATIGVVGGSGLYDLEGLSDVREVTYETPWGPPSDALIHGHLDGVELVFLPRHGRGHRLLPTEVPYRANVHALKQAGVGWLISVSAVGSLSEAIAPGHAVIVDQYIDRTRRRDSTFFGDGIVAHVAFGEPTCETLRGYLTRAAEAQDLVVHDGGTYVCMEGPAFSTRAESELYRSWGAQVIGMTALPEAKLAREASMSYATLAFATDYDCWRRGHDDVTVEQVVAVLMANVERARRVLIDLVPLVAAHGGPPPMHDALRDAIFTPPSAIGADVRARLGPILAPYLE
ncbi:MAG TPA: S-methyl-5'-thioadenosine phosphorylase [Deltaproteobacteria bacterium]|nr:S-methyl-5'-thioadenosine phosphorylase [Deltaproteobacteria bacterium]